MTAVVRSCVQTHIASGIGSAFRGEAKPGDILIAFQSADSGGHGAMVLSGDWEWLDSFPGGLWPGTTSSPWAGTNVYVRTAEADEPFSYSASNGSVADGLVTIVSVAGALAGSVTVANGMDASTVAPAAFPDSASGLQLRYAAGVPSPPGANVSWTTPAGFTYQVSGQGNVWTTAFLVSAPVVSTAPVETAFLSASPSMVASHAITILVASAEAEPPAPPVVQPYAPGKGSSKYRYVFTRLLDRTYLGDLDLSGVSFDKRILQPGSFSATIPIPNRKIGDQVAEIIPREAAGDPDSYPLDRGPGVITVQVFREGEPWGEYWITSATASRSRRGTPEIALRGSTLDAYLAQVEIQDDLFYAGTDQIDIARGLINHLQGRPNANVSLSLQEGTSGVPRDHNYLDSEGGKYGQRLVELAQTDDGFEWMINLELVGGVLIRRWVWGYPKLGVLDSTPHRFADGRNGGDILEWSEESDALRGATRWRARGGTASSDASISSTPAISSVHEATAALAAGWPRIDKTLTYSTVIDTPTLDDYAAYWAATAPGALKVDQATITFGKNPSFSPNNLGDAARFYFDNAWHRGVWRTRRIIGIGVTPTSRSNGKEEARLVLEGQEVPGA